MNFTQLKTFYLVATMGTFQKAADKLYTSQPTVSARIVALENWLGVQLFDRSAHRAQLTPQGRALLELARRFLELETVMRSSVGQKGELQGIYRIGASDTLALSWLPSFFTELHRRYPAAGFEYQLGASPRLRDELVGQTLDICFMIGPVSEPNVISLPLCETPVVLAAAPALELHGRKLQLCDITEYTVLTLERRTQTYQSLVRLFEKAGPIGNLSGNSSLAFAIALALEGYGILAVPAISIKGELDEGTLKLLDVSVTPDSPKFALSYVDGPIASSAQKIADEAYEHLAGFATPMYVNLLFDVD